MALEIRKGDKRRERRRLRKIVENIAVVRVLRYTESQYQTTEGFGNCCCTKIAHCCQHTFIIETPYLMFDD